MLVKFGIVYKKDKSFLRSSPALRGAGLKEENAKAKELASTINAFLKKGRHEVLPEAKFGSADFILILGGDGTFIHKACEFAPLGVPFLGINTGNLGFLTACEASDWKEALNKLGEGKYFVSERITIDAIVEGRKEVYRAINEIFIKGLFRAIDLKINVGGERLIKVFGDGVIVATQTGSTAYSLSSGGPIVDANLDCLLLTPINPIGLPIPSIVLSADEEIEVTLSKGEDVSLVLDGQEHTKVKENDLVRIKKGEFRVKFVYFDKHQFLKSLNAKFGLSNRSLG